MDKDMDKEMDKEKDAEEELFWIPVSGRETCLPCL